MKSQSKNSPTDLTAQTLISPPQTGDVFERVAAILEQARGNVVRAVNSNMIVAYWLIGREIVQEIQGGDERAEYGKQVLEDLSRRLNKRYRRGFSVPNLQNFRKFYLAYPDRIAIQYPVGTKSGLARCEHSARNPTRSGHHQPLANLSAGAWERLRVRRPAETPAL